VDVGADVSNVDEVGDFDEEKIDEEREDDEEDAVVKVDTPEDVLDVFEVEEAILGFPISQVADCVASAVTTLKYGLMYSLSASSIAYM
jgi:hypothetical protein